MGLHTPHFGPHAGKLCRDGVPVDLNETHTARVVVCLPDSTDAFQDEAAEKHARGVNGAALALQQESKRYGAEMSFEDCRSRVATARKTATRRRE